MKPRDLWFLALVVAAAVFATCAMCSALDPSPDRDWNIQHAGVEQEAR